MLLIAGVCLKQAMVSCRSTRKNSSPVKNSRTSFFIFVTSAAMGSLLFGPGSTIVGLIWARDEIILGVETEEKEKGKEKVTVKVKDRVT